MIPAAWQRATNGRVAPEEREHWHPLFQAALELGLHAGRRRHGRDQVYAERSLGEGMGSTNLLPDEVWRHADHPEHAESSGVGDRGRELGASHAAHPGLDDRVAEAEHSCESG